MRFLKDLKKDLTQQQTKNLLSQLILNISSELPNSSVHESSLNSDTSHPEPSFTFCFGFMLKKVQDVTLMLAASAGVVTSAGGDLSVFELTAGN